MCGITGGEAIFCHLCNLPFLQAGYWNCSNLPSQQDTESMVFCLPPVHQRVAVTLVTALAVGQSVRCTVEGAVVEQQSK